MRWCYEFTVSLLAVLGNLSNEKSFPIFSVFAWLLKHSTLVKSAWIGYITAFTVNRIIIWASLTEFYLKRYAHLLDFAGSARQL